MATAKAHYDTHLAAYYAWSVGGTELAMARGIADLDALGLSLAAGQSVLDLGAGFGTHALPLARQGVRVTAVDGSDALLTQIRDHAADLPIQTAAADIVEYATRAEPCFDAVLCMGDTITHLPSEQEARRLVEAAATRLNPGGTLIVTMRDYSQAETGTQHCILVRGEMDRLASCSLTYEADRVRVNDLLHERIGKTWRLSCSSYDKLRLAPQKVGSWLDEAGCQVRTAQLPTGMGATIARRPGAAESAEAS